MRARDNTASRKELELVGTTLVPNGGIRVLAEAADGEQMIMDVTADDAWALVYSLSSGVMLDAAGLYDERDLSTAALYACGFGLSCLEEEDEDADDYALVTIDISHAHAIELAAPKDELVRLAHAILLKSRAFPSYHS